MKGIIAASCWTRKSSLFRTNQTANIYRTTIANMSTVMNEGAKMRYKEFTTKFLTVVGLLVEPIKAIAIPNCFLEVYLSIIQTPIAVTSG